MTIKNFFSVAALLTLALGLVWVLFPDAMLTSWGTTANGIAVYMSRRYAVLFFGYALIFWLTRNAPLSETRRAIIAGGFVVSGLMALASLMGVLASTINALGLAALSVEALLTFGFGYFLFARTG